MDYRIILIECVTFVVLLPTIIQAGKTPAWNECKCRWDSWQPWSSCSESCSGGWRKRMRKVFFSDEPGCDTFVACASNDMGWDYSGCNDICFNGGTIKRQSIYSSYCQCPSGKTGPCCEQTVTCGTPNSISKGRYVGNDFTYGHTVTYVCDNDYGMVDPSLAQRQCTEYGYWSGRTPTCLFAKSCNSGPCQNNGTCINLLGDFKCMCTQGWTGKMCEVDIQPPVVTGCPEDKAIIVSTLSSNQTWTEPIFNDPHGGKVHVTKNYQTPSFEFPWGVFTVYYSAVKSNGLATNCTFNISIKPHPCSKLSPPKNGIIACNGWETNYTSVCKFYCNHGFTMPRGFKPSVIYICGASGNWLPSESLLECFPKDLAGQTDGPTFGNCSNSEELQGISDQYLADIRKSSANAVCLNHADKCLAENVNVQC